MKVIVRDYRMRIGDGVEVDMYKYSGNRVFIGYQRPFDILDY